MPEKEKMDELEAEQVAGGAILSRGHRCKNCGEKFDVVLPGNSLDPTGYGGVPSSGNAIKELLEKHGQDTIYCPKCRNDPDRQFRFL